ncbi:MAG: NUDIX hydrolase [Ancalomicrobiaceae bacterium]|nr:NUDIX hydrolase [Ancalomicrobiaceae bacterium]
MSFQAPVAPPRRPTLGVSICVWRGEEVLLVRRANPPGVGLWAPVGGKVEWGESLAEAALREVAEETSVACEIAAFSQLREIRMPDKGADVGHHVVLAVYAARWLAGEPVAGDDADRAEWVALDRLAEVALVEGTLPYILATQALART